MPTGYITVADKASLGDKPDTGTGAIVRITTKERINNLLEYNDPVTAHDPAGLDIEIICGRYDSSVVIDTYRWTWNLTLYIYKYTIIYIYIYVYTKERIPDFLNVKKFSVFDLFRIQVIEDTRLQRRHAKYIFTHASET